MQQPSGNPNNKLPGAFYLKKLPAYAAYLLNHRLDKSEATELNLTLTSGMPVIRYYNEGKYTLEELIELLLPAQKEFLTYVSENKLNEYLVVQIDKWEKYNLNNTQTTDLLEVQDLTLASHLRKKILLSQVQTYTSDINEIMAIAGEIDDYIFEANSRVFSAYMRIRNKKANELNEYLLNQEAQLLEAQEIASLGSFEWSLSGKPSRYTPQVAQIFEMTAESKLEEFLQYVHPGDREKLNRSMDLAMKGEKKNLECEFRYQRNGNEKVLWTKGVVIFENNVPAAIKSTVMDITNRHYMLQQLKRNEELFNQAQKLTHIGNWTWELQTGKIRFSDELRRIYGLDPEEEITYDRFISFVHPDDKAEVCRLLEHAAQTGLPHSLDLRIIRDDGEIRTIRRYTEVLTDEKGVPYKLSGTGQDISVEQKIRSELEIKTKQLAELNLSLEQKNTALERSNKELTSFSYVASHDLQEPLRKIKTFSNLILEKEHQLSQEGKECFERIVNSAGRMQTLIDDLLTFSRMQVNESAFIPVDLNTIVSEIKSFYKEAIQEKRLEIESEKLPTLNAVAFQVRQLFDNIISNSVKYSHKDKKTVIHITCETVDEKNMFFMAGKENRKFHRISISDNGIGFDQKYSEKIFEMFQRLHGKAEFGGTGIGLSICKKIVDNHKGYITAHGRVNEGATFEFYLPVA